ncbi:PapB/FocB family fimbrial expression transcriptional regulator [Escherichia coli]
MVKYMRHSALNPDLVHAARYLYPGKVVLEHFNKLMEVSKIIGRKINAALKDFLVNGKARKEIFCIHGISPGYFSHKLNQLRHCSRMIMDLLPYYVCDDADNIQNERIH